MVWTLQFIAPTALLIALENRYDRHSRKQSLFSGNEALRLLVSADSSQIEITP